MRGYIKATKCPYTFYFLYKLRSVEIKDFAGDPNPDENSELDFKLVVECGNELIRIDMFTDHDGLWVLDGGWFDACLDPAFRGQSSRYNVDLVEWNDGDEKYINMVIAEYLQTWAGFDENGEI